MTGCLDAGMGYTHINKLLSGLNIPQYNWQSYKIHEVEVGLAGKKLARESCIRAVAEERRLTLENIDKIEKMLYVYNCA